MADASVPPGHRSLIESAWFAAAAYTVIAVGLTWPVAPNLARDVPGDLGDPVFVGWALARASGFLAGLLTGNGVSWAEFWQAGIFHPAPWTGALSEHFLAHALLTLPVWMLTGNVILCYNLHFLGSAVLSGVGVYVLVRRLTGNAVAAFVGGMCFAFAPYRVASASHLQVLSAQWMPWALLAFHHFIAERRWRWLAAGVATLVLQGGSSAYYMVMFPPVLAAWCAAMLAAERRWRDVQTLVGLLGAAVVSAGLLWPVVSPYLAARTAHAALRRSAGEAATFAADVASWITASPALTFWGWLRTFPHLEGDLFVGVAMPVLALLGVAVAGRSTASRRQRWTAGFCAGVIVLAAWMALGPAPSAFGRPLGAPSLFGVVAALPGIDAVRVPARFHVMVLLAAAIAAGLGAHGLRGRRRLVAVLAGLALLDGLAVPFPRNLVWAPTAEAASPPPRLTPLDPPAVYRYLSTLGPDSAVVHFPLGAVEHDLRYMFYSASFRVPMVNGYSGAFPADWGERIATLTWPMRDPARAWGYLQRGGISHAVVHQDVWRDDTGAQWAAELESRGARLVFHDGRDQVFALPFATRAR